MQKVQLGEGARGYELVQRQGRKRAIPSHISDEYFIKFFLLEYVITAKKT